MELQTINDILATYGQRLASIDQWFNACQEQFPEQIRCGQGCSGCCRGLFDITLLDAWYLKAGFDRLPEEMRKVPLTRAHGRLDELRRLWPDLGPPYVLNFRPDTAWGELMPDEDETPCPLLADDGRCLVYEHRPMTCRLHGLPLVDQSGEVMHDEWCTENFVQEDPLQLAALRGPFDALFREEVRLGRRFTEALLDMPVSELDTFIPLALLLDMTRFDWAGWWQSNRARILAATELNQAAQ